jgi:hypothetical protein
MNLTTTIISWSELQPLTRGIYSIIFAVGVYLGFRYFIHKVNKAVASVPPKRQSGNYWKRLERQARAQAE